MRCLNCRHNQPFYAFIHRQHPQALECVQASYNIAPDGVEIDKVIYRGCLDVDERHGFHGSNDQVGLQEWSKCIGQLLRVPGRYGKLTVNALELMDQPDAVAAV